MNGCRPLTDLELESVLKSLDFGRYKLRNRALFILGLKSGFRISELLSLKIGDVYQDGNIKKHVSVERKNMKKKLKGRSIILHPVAQQALMNWIECRERGSIPDPKSFLFESRKSKDHAISRITAWKIFSHAFKACQLDGKLGTHSMRKTFAKKIHEILGKDLVRTQKALGHANVNSTISYLSFDEREIDDAILKS